MSCNGACIIIPSQTYGSGSVPVGRSMYAGDRAPRYDAPSYFSDPNAITALEFEQLREPRYKRNADSVELPKAYAAKDGYARSAKQLYAMGVPNQMPQGQARKDQISRLDQNVAYFASLQAGSVDGFMLDYSILATNRLAWERMKGLLNGGMSVVSGNGMPQAGPVQVYTLLPKDMYDQSRLQDAQAEDARAIYARVNQSTPASADSGVGSNEGIARKRTLLEDLIAKEKEALMQ
ncbi:MAG: hypothetical protein ABIJ21_03675 [Nanoarchaeota archaeon]